MGTTSIQLTRATVERLKKEGKMGETYEDVVKRLLDEQQKRRKTIGDILEGFPQGRER